MNLKEEFEKISGAIDGQNQTLPEKSELTLPKLEFGISKEKKNGCQSWCKQCKAEAKVKKHKKY